MAPQTSGSAASSPLSKGALVCREQKGAWLHFEIEEGILEVTPEGVRILTDSAERVPIKVAPRF